jgi:hypothetical protein
MEVTIGNTMQEPTLKPGFSHGPQAQQRNARTSDLPANPTAPRHWDNSERKDFSPCELSGMLQRHHLLSSYSPVVQQFRE